MGEGSAESPNVEAVHRAADAFNHKELDEFLEVCDSGIEFESRMMDVEGGEPFHGHEGLREWWDSLFAITTDFRSEVLTVDELGSVTIAKVQHRGRGSSSGAPLDVLLWHVTDWLDGRAVWWRVLTSEEEAQEAADSRA